MAFLKAHFNGYAIVLDEPANLRPNQRLLVKLDEESPATTPTPTDFSTLRGLAKNITPHPRFKSDDDLWGKSDPPSSR